MPWAMRLRDSVPHPPGSNPPPSPLPTTPRLPAIFRPARCNVTRGDASQGTGPVADDKGKKRISGASLRHAFHEIIWPRRRLVLFGLVLILMNRLAGLVLPIATRPLIDDVIATGDLPGLFRLLGAVALAVVVQAATSYTLTMRLSVEAQHLIADLRTQVQRHVLSLPVRVFDNTRSGDLVSRIMEDVRGVRNLVGTGLVQLVGGVITAVAGFAYLLSISPMMTLLTVGPLAAFAFISTKAFRTLRPAFRERGKIRAEVTGRLTESLGGIRVIKGFHAVAAEGTIFRDGVLRIFRNIRKTLTTSSLVTSAGTFFMGMAGVLVMGYGGWLIVQGQLTVGELFSFTFLLGFLIAPVIQMANIGTQMTEAFAGLDRTAELLSWPTEDDDPKRVVEMPPIRGAGCASRTSTSGMRKTSPCCGASASMSNPAPWWRWWGARDPASPPWPAWPLPS